MQDGDHSALINKLPPKPGLLMGVTNPFFEKSCNHWPHVLSLGRRVVYVCCQNAIQFTISFSTRPQSGNGSPSLGMSAGPAPGWRTKTHRRYISKDRALLRQLETACRGNDRTSTCSCPKLLCATELQTNMGDRNRRLARFKKTFLLTDNTVYHAVSKIPEYSNTQPRRGQKRPGTG